MKKLTICTWLWALVAASGQAATLAPIVDKGALGAKISEIALPNTLAKDLASGFENRVLMRVVLLAQSAAIVRADVMITVKYDLWDERYVVRHIVGGRPISELVLKQAQEVVGYLATLKLERLFAIGDLPKERDLTLQAEVLINPIEREKIERLREWVAANSAPRDAIGGDSAFTPKPNDLFNRIFEQYTRGADVAAPWRLTITSQPFRLAQLLTESRDR